MTAAVEIRGYRETLRVLRKLPKDAQDYARNTVGNIAERAGAQISTAGTHAGRQARHVASTVRVRRDRVPKIAIGGAAKLAVNEQHGRILPTANKLLYGCEFGSKGNWRFPKPWGTEGYWIYPTLRRIQPYIVIEWNKAVDRIADEWGQ